MTRIRLRPLYVSVGLLAGFGCASASAADRVVTANDSGKQLRIVSGRALRVVLGENPSTGYGWRVTVKPSAGKLRLLSDHFVSDPHAPGVVGVGGKRTWRYRARGTGHTALVIKLFPPAAGSPAVQAFRLRIVVVRKSAPGRKRAAAVRCDNVRGHRVLQTSRIKVVTQSFHTISRRNRGQVVGKRYLACALPRGSVFRLARSSADYLYPGSTHGPALVSAGVVLRHTAGPFLEVQQREGDLAGNYSRDVRRVFDVRSGHSYVYSKSEQGEGATANPAAAQRVLLNKLGQLAGVAFNDSSSTVPDTDPQAGYAEVVAFNSQGQRKILDSAPRAQIPAASLHLHGSTVTWTNAGQARTAVIQ